MPDPVKPDLWIAVFFCAVWASVLIWRGWNGFAGDLTPLYVASYLWAHGQHDLIYAAPEGFFGLTVEAWAEVVAKIGLHDKLVYPYIYPPLWAALFSGVTDSMSLTAFSNCVLVLHLALLGSLPLLAARTLGRGARTYTAWVMISLALMSLSIPVLSAINLNQPSILIAFLVLLAFERQAAGHPVAAGVACGFAACIKLTPGIFALYFLFRSDFRALGAFAATCLAFLIVSLALCGVPMHAAYVEAMQGASRVVFFSPMNQSARSALGAAVLLYQQGAAPPGAHRDFSLPASIVPYLNLWMGLATAAALARTWQVTRKAPRQEAQAVAIIALSLVLALFGPIGWTHYYILPIALLPSFLRVVARPVVISVAVPLMLCESMSVVQNVYAGQSAQATFVYTLATVLLWLAMLLAVLTPRKSLIS